MIIMQARSYQPLLLLLLWFFASTFLHRSNALQSKVFPQFQSKSSPGTQTTAVQELIARLIPEHHHLFRITIDPSQFEQEGVQIEKDNNTNYVTITATDGVAAAWGFHYYLKYFCHCHISWQTQELAQLPAHLPNVQLTLLRREVFRYYQNVCTSSYSFAWWSWPEWEKHIDWMALNGINFPLAFNGQEAIWKRVFEKYFNLTQNDIDQHFTGPAFLAWERMANMRGFGGPLTPKWHEFQIGLQKKILKQMRDFGMVPILPNFAGHVPRAFKRLFPNAKLTLASKWNDFNDTYCCPYILDPSDPLFKNTGEYFMKEMIAEFGTDHAYNCDPFNELVPHNDSSEYLQHYAAIIYTYMRRVDPSAVWILQNWFFVNDDWFWTNERAQAFLSGVPIGGLIILDLMSEHSPQYYRLNHYYGHYYIWCMLHNFGGTLGMYGALPRINQEFFKARNFSNGRQIGVGLTPEGINQNYILYDFVMELPWRDTPVDLSKWLMEYTWRRYGGRVPAALNAWTAFVNTIYNYTGDARFHGKYVLNVRPRTTIQPWWYWYDWDKFARGAIDFLQIKDQLPATESYLYDLVDVTRQVLQGMADKHYQLMIKHFRAKNLKDFQAAMKTFLEVFTDMECILASNKAYLLGNWLEPAKALGKNYEAYDGQFEYNARNQITLWGPAGEIIDYANKQWSGVVQDYFLPRWKMFLTAMNKSLTTEKSFNERKIRLKIFSRIEQPFTFSRQVYPTTPKGNTYELAYKILTKWLPEHAKSLILKNPIGCNESSTIKYKMDELIEQQKSTPMVTTII